MSNQVYVQPQNKFQASTGPNIYGLAGTQTVAANFDALITVNDVILQKQPEQNDLQTGAIVIKQSGMYSITSMLNLSLGSPAAAIDFIHYIRLTSSDPALNTINLALDASAQPVATSGNRVSCITWAGYLEAGSALGIRLKNNSTPATLDVLAGASVFNITRLY